MEDNFKLKQFINEDIDAPNNYRDIYSDVIKKTNNLNREAGILAYKDRKDIEVAKSVLDGVYPRVKIRDIEKNEEDDDNYYLLYSYDVNESFDEDDKDDGLKFSPNLNPEGTPIGKWNGSMNLVESRVNDMDYLVDLITENDWVFSNVVEDYLGNTSCVSDEEFEGNEDYWRYMTVEEFANKWLPKCSDSELTALLNKAIEDYKYWAIKDLERDTATQSEEEWLYDNFPEEYNDIQYQFKRAREDRISMGYSESFGESVEKHDTLNQKIFNGDELDPEVKDKLLEIVDRFKYNLEESDIKLDIKDVRIIGSNASYNYTDKSDIDLHIFADLSVYPDQEVLAQKVYDAYKALWNNKFDPIIRGHEVEIYVEPYTGD